tara:strand:+ start:741 stop:983 length:243 start_codon:yes stop_codon:yes gene_type:complete
MFKKIMLCIVFFLSFTMSCSDKKKQIKHETVCDQIKNIVTDCMGLHRGALGYINSCGDISLEKIENLNSCEEILNYIENN